MCWRWGSPAGPAQAPAMTVVTASTTRPHRPGAYRPTATTAYRSDVAAVRYLLGTALLGIVMSACGSPGPHAPQVRAGTGGAGSPTVPAVDTTVPAATSTTPPPPITTAVTQPPPASPATTSAAPSPLLGRVGGARQAVVVSAAGYGSTTATLTTWQRDGDGWTPVHGPWTAYVDSRHGPAGREAGAATAARRRAPTASSSASASSPIRRAAPLPPDHRSDTRVGGRPGHPAVQPAGGHRRPRSPWPRRGHVPVRRPTTTGR